MADEATSAQANAAFGLRATGATDRTVPKSPVLQKLLAYWQSKCRDGRLPGRADIDPLDLRELLPFVYLIDVLPDGIFRIRLLGEEHIAVYGHGLVGRTIDEAFRPAVAAEFNRLYAAVVRRREPVLNRGQVTWMPHRAWMHYEGLHAPLASDGAAVDTIFGAGDFTG